VFMGNSKSSNHTYTSTPRILSGLSYPGEPLANWVLAPETT
jgi:hypothetical protein